MKRKALLLILVVALSGTFIGCGAAAPLAPSVGAPVEMEGDFGAAPPPEPAAMQERSAGLGGTEDTAVWNVEGAAVERMIVRTATLGLVVEDTAESLEAIERLAKELGGYISNLQSWRQDDQLAATVTLRVPAESFDQARERIKALAIEVENENVSGQDVTEEYVDLEARVKNLEVAEGELLELLATAQEDYKDAESILDIYQRITDVRQQIEQLKGRMQYLENAAALATMTISITPEEIEEPVVEPGWEPLKQAREALRSLVNALKALADVLIWVVLFFLPLAAILALPLVLAWLVWYLRRRRKRRAESK